MKKIHILLIALLCALNISNAQWQQTNGPNGGSINCLAVCGSNILAGTIQGAYVSSDNGFSWTLTNNGLPGPTPYVNSLAVSGSNIFAGTEQGVFLSSDNGANWVPAGIDSTHIYSLATDGTNIFAGSWEDGMYLSADNGQNWTNVSNGLPIMGGSYSEIYSILISGSNIFAGTQNGLFLSSDNGANWTEISTGIMCPDISAITLSGSDIFVGCGDGIFRSTNNGINWTEVYSGTMVRALASDGTNIFAGTWYDGIIMSVDNGLNWTLANNGLPDTYYSTIIFNGSDIFAASAECGIFHSSDNGANWTPSCEGIINTSIKSMAVSGSYLFAGSFGNGIFSTVDGGNNWTLLNDTTFPNTYIRGIGANGATILAGTHGDGIYISSDYGASWTQANNGLQMPFISAFAFSGSDIYAVGEDGFYLSTNNAVSWTYHEIDTSVSLSMVGSLGVDGVNIFAGTDHGIYLSTDNGTSWIKLSNGPYSVNTIAVSGNNIFAGSSGGIYLSTDNGTSWSLLQNGSPTAMVNSLAISGTNIFAATDQGIFLSPNNGLTWTDIGASLPSQRIQSVTYDGGFLYAGVYNMGVWKCNLWNLNISTYNFSGNVFNDINNNGIKDIGENGLANILIKTKADNWVFSTDSAGDYTAYSHLPVDTLLIVNPSLYANSSPVYYAVMQSDTGKNFAVHYTPNVIDLRVTLTHLTAARPGFDDVIRLTYTNVGTDTISGYINLNFDDSLIFISCSPTQTSINNNIITWNYSNLIPLESRNINISFHIPSTVPIGYMLSFSSTVYPVTGDAAPENNSNDLTQTVSGSCDPNEKEVIPGDGISPLQIANGENLVYAIHFQNTGTDTAFNIVIIDTISPNLDITSIKILSSSHPCTYQVSGPGIVEFSFPNILLPDSNVNLIGSNGFVKYAIKPKSSLILGNSITNTAYIYFDFNTAVATNTTSTTVKNPTGLFDVAGNMSMLSIYPNPSNDYISIQYNLPEKPQVEIFTMQGKSVFRTKADSNSSIKIDVSGFPSGLYFVKVKSEKGILVEKFIKE
jgi:uncharacterized repeat protein (TIGR01451 family)